MDQSQEILLGSYTVTMVTIVLHVRLAIDYLYSTVTKLKSPSTVVEQQWRKFLSIHWKGQVWLPESRLKTVPQSGTGSRETSVVKVVASERDD